MAPRDIKDLIRGINKAYNSAGYLHGFAKILHQHVQEVKRSVDLLLPPQQDDEDVDTTWPREYTSERQLKKTLKDCKDFMGALKGSSSDKKTQRNFLRAFTQGADGSKTRYDKLKSELKHCAMELAKAIDRVKAEETKKAFAKLDREHLNDEDEARKEALGIVNAVVDGPAPETHEDATDMKEILNSMKDMLDHLVTSQKQKQDTEEKVASRLQALQKKEEETADTKTVSFIEYKMSDVEWQVQDPAIHKGKFSDIWDGEIRQERRRVAVKKLKRTGERTDLKKRLERQLKFSFIDDHILPIFGFCEEPTLHIFWIISSFMENGDLHHFIERRSDKSARLSVLKRVRIALEIASGMSFLHNQYPVHILHRDLRSTKILLDGEHHVKITDFERASEYMSGKTADLSLVQAESTDLDCSGFSVAWLPPECYCAENPTVKKPGDIYGFGIIMYEIGMWETPYLGKTAKDVQTQLRARDAKPLKLLPARIKVELHKDCYEFGKVANSCLRLDPGRRPRFSKCVDDLKQLVEELEDFVYLNLHISTGSSFLVRLVSSDTGKRLRQEFDRKVQPHMKDKPYVIVYESRELTEGDEMKTLRDLNMVGQIERRCHVQQRYMEEEALSDTSDDEFDDSSDGAYN